MTAPTPRLLAELLEAMEKRQEGVVGTPNRSVLINYQSRHLPPSPNVIIYNGFISAEALRELSDRFKNLTIARPHEAHQEIEWDDAFLYTPKKEPKHLLDGLDGFRFWIDDISKRKVAKSPSGSHTGGMEPDKRLTDIVNSLVSLLEENPDLAPTVQENVAKVFASFAEKKKKDPDFVAGLIAKGRQAWIENTQKTKATGRLNPAAFIRQTFPEEVANKTLLRSMLQDIHTGLYDAYANWIRRHPEDDLKLPTQIRTEYTDAELETALPSTRAYGAAKNRKWRAREKAISR